MFGIKLNIHGKLLLLFLLLSLIPMLTIGIISYRNSRQALTENIGHKVEELARQAMARVDQQMANHFQEVQIWAGLEVMQDVFTEDADGRISATLSDFKTGYRNYHQLHCLNIKGKIIASGQLDYIGKPMANTVWFREALAGRSYMSDVTRLEYNKDIGIIFASPIHSLGSNEIIGVLSATLDWKSLYPLLEDITVNASLEKGSQTWHLMLINNEGTIIYAPEFERQDGAILNKNMFDAEEIKNHLQQGKKEGNFIAQDEHNELSLVGYARLTGIG